MRRRWAWARRRCRRGPDPRRNRGAAAAGAVVGGAAGAVYANRTKDHDIVLSPGSAMTAVLNAPFSRQVAAKLAGKLESWKENGPEIRGLFLTINFQPSSFPSYHRLPLGASSRTKRSNLASPRIGSNPGNWVIHQSATPGARCAPASRAPGSACPAAAQPSATQAAPQETRAGAGGQSSASAPRRRARRRCRPPASAARPGPSRTCECRRDAPRGCPAVSLPCRRPGAATRRACRARWSRRVSAASTVSSCAAPPGRRAMLSRKARVKRAIARSGSSATRAPEQRYSFIDVAHVRHRKPVLEMRLASRGASRTARAKASRTPA